LGACDRLFGLTPFTIGSDVEGDFVQHWVENDVDGYMPIARAQAFPISTASVTFEDKTSTNVVVSNGFLFSTPNEDELYSLRFPMQGTVRAFELRATNLHLVDRSLRRPDSQLAIAGTALTLAVSPRRATASEELDTT